MRELSLPLKDHVFLLFYLLCLTDKNNISDIPFVKGVMFSLPLSVDHSRVIALSALGHFC